MVCSMLIKHGCAAGGERKCCKQGFISLVFQAAGFSLSITGIEAERWWGGLLWRCGGSVNQGRSEFCCSVGCYPEVGCLPDLTALAYQWSRLQQSAVFSTASHNALPFPLRFSPISQQQETIRSHSCPEFSLA